jgi:hypothetical protein
VPTGDAPLGGTNHGSSLGQAELGGGSRRDGDPASERRTVSALIRLARLLAKQVVAEANRAIASDHSKDPTKDEIER